MPRTATITNDYVPTVEQAWGKLFAESRARLVARLKDHGVATMPYMPMADNILVLRLPPPPIETKTGGGIFIPETSQVEPEPNSEGVLVQAGCLARDVLRSHGILLGDHVQIGRFAGWERALDEDKKGKRILQMKERDVLGSFDLHDRLWGPKPTMRIVFDHDTEEHRIVPITED
jgi:co-chaperonin GroES (HSP10)